jgi:hypothetical protein
VIYLEIAINHILAILNQISVLLEYNFRTYLPAGRQVSPIRYIHSKKHGIPLLMVLKKIKNDR